MAKILIVVDSTAKAEFMKGHFGEDAECLVCSWPLFQTSHQALPTATAGLHCQFEAHPNGQAAAITALDNHRDQEILLVLDDNAKANYLCWQIGGYLSRIGARPERIKRISPLAFTTAAIDTALNSPLPVDDRQGLDYYGRLLFDECLARHLIRLIGTDRGPGSLPLRQTSLATLFLLSDRKKERLMFQPIVKWQVQAQLKDDEGTGFTAHLAKGLDIPADGLLRDAAKARGIKDQVTNLPFVVEAIRRTPLTIAPPQPYQLADLAHEGKVRLDLTPTATMSTIRRLFHGVTKDGKVVGLISSYSPKSGAPTADMLAALRREVARGHGQSLPMDAPSPDAGAIIPLLPELSGFDLADSLTHEEAALYDLIRTRALASQMRPAVGETITVDLRADKKSVFQSLFHEWSELGFLQLTPEEAARNQPPCPLAQIREGQEFRPLAVRCQEIKGESQLVERYTIDTLFAALADFSIPADPDTLAMVEAMVRAGYVTVSPQGALSPTDNTASVVTLLDRAFPRMQGINLSAYIEQTVAEAVSGRKDLLFALKQFDQTLMLHGKTLVKAKITTKLPPRSRASTTIIKQPPPSPEARALVNAEGGPAARPSSEVPLPAASAAEESRLFVPEEENPRPLEEADAPVAEFETLAQETSQADPPLMEQETITNGSEAEEDQREQDGHCPPDLMRIFAEAVSSPEPAAGPVESAPDYQAPGEGSALRATSPLPGQHRPCPVCDRAMLLKEDPFGAFWGCSGFPGCRYSEAVTPTDQGLACPLCGQGLRRKQTPTGKSFYVCESRDCQFISWSRPHYLPCGLCDSPYLVEKTVRGVGRLRCPRAGCPYEQPLVGVEREMGPAATGSGPKKVLVRRVAAGPGTGGQTKKVRVVRKH